MDGPRNRHSKWGQLREKQISYKVTNMRNLMKHDTKELMKQKQTQKSETKFTIIKGEMWWGKEE